MAREPSYAALGVRELSRRAAAGLELLAEPCRVCARHCSVDRLHDEPGLCLVGRHAVVASSFAHFGEEDCLRGWNGSGTVFFNGCNLRCVFCQNYQIAWSLRGGTTVGPDELAGIMLELQDAGCHNINWVTPEHVVPVILEAMPPALERGLRLPIVYNTSSYDAHECLELLDGVVDVYMPDFKLWTPERTRRYVQRTNYAEVARAAISEMHRQVGDLEVDERGLATRGLLLRHLVMPGLVDETEAILAWVAEELGPSTYVNLMGQYYPCAKVGENGTYSEIDRPVYREEYERALAAAERLGLRRLDARRRAEGIALPSGESDDADAPGRARGIAVGRLS